MPPTALVWFKRDLRVADHAPLAEAQHFERALAVFIIEPEWLASPECDPQHLGFTLACLQPLQADLAARGLPLLVCTGSAVPVLQSLSVQFGVTHLFSHEETGPGWTYTRDLAVGRWGRDQGITWTEWPQTGVVRRLRSRSGWAGRWAQRMGSARITVDDTLDGGFKAAPGAQATPVPTLADLGLPAARPLPPAGEAAARATLADFLAGRASGYRRALSSPLTAETGCSRLSAHLAYGTLSMRWVHQATEHTMATTADRALAHGLRGFAGRLRWHCHFMQKLEDEPAIEYRNFSRAHDGLREDHFDRARFDAWCDGRTGYPMVDACMRQLRATGWLNFRMRAMLVSFAAYHLWLHWREPGQFLARQFLDFEAGIHWSQMQMQSGTTGINTLRIYSPRKQAQDHDPDGDYVRRWVPEFGTAAYPEPIVDERLAVAAAKERLYALRGQRPTRQEADAIQHKHGSRKSGLPSTAGRPSKPKTKAQAKALADDRQQELF
jgi:deoxyribodipyrimidine photo-lyase